LEALKILVAGHFGAGKSTFVKNASDVEALSVEKKTTSREERAYKSKTTVAMDFGESLIEEEDRKVAVFGVPGQDRFSFMWPILSKGTQGYVFMLDSARPEMWHKTLEQINFFLSRNPAPFVICANKQDLPDAKSIKEIREALELEPHVKLLPCVATDKDTVKQILTVLLNEIERERAAETVAQEVSG